MLIKPSTVLQYNYPEISDLVHQTDEPVYITKDGESDLVITSIDAFERKEQLLKLRMKILQAEEERFAGVKTLSVAEARKRINTRPSHV